MIRRVVLVTTLVASSAAAQVPFDSATRWVDSMLVPYSAGRTPGCVVGVTRDGALAFEKAYGLADVARSTPLTPSTRFYIASLSKQFTAMSIVLLAQDGSSRSTTRSRSGCPSCHRSASRSRSGNCSITRAACATT